MPQTPGIARGRSPHRRPRRPSPTPARRDHRTDPTGPMQIDHLAVTCATLDQGTAWAEERRPPPRPRRAARALRHVQPPPVPRPRPLPGGHRAGPGGPAARPPPLVRARPRGRPRARHLDRPRARPRRALATAPARIRRAAPSRAGRPPLDRRGPAGRPAALGRHLPHADRMGPRPAPLRTAPRPGRPARSRWSWATPARPASKPSSRTSPTRA